MTVLLVRADGNAADARALESVGVAVEIDPYVAVTDAADAGPAGELMTALRAADAAGTWLVLTSRRAFPAWARLVGAGPLEVALRTARQSGLRVAVVGPATAASLPSWLTPDLVAEESSADLARQLLAMGAPGTVAWPVSAIAPDVVATELAQAGWQVHRAPVYTTAVRSDRPPTADGLVAGRYQGVLLRSPSAVRAVAHHGGLPTGTTAYAVGATTAAAADHHWRVVEIDSTPAQLVAEAIAADLTARLDVSAR